MTKEEILEKFRAACAAQRSRFDGVEPYRPPTLTTALIAATDFADRCRAGRLALLRYAGRWGAAFGEPSPLGWPFDPSHLAAFKTLQEALTAALTMRTTFPGSALGPATSLPQADPEPRDDGCHSPYYSLPDALRIAEHISQRFNGEITTLRANGRWGAAFGNPMQYAYDARRLAGFTSLQAALNHLIYLRPRYPDEG